jgi:hypothetical protein
VLSREGRQASLALSPPWRGAKFSYSTATGIQCSPLVEGDRLWFTTNLSEVVCLDIAPLLKGQGEPRTVWKLDMVKELGVRVTAVPTMSLGALIGSIGVSWQGRLYVSTNSAVAEDGKTIPAPKAPSLMCLDKKTRACRCQSEKTRGSLGECLSPAAPAPIAVATTIWYLLYVLRNYPEPLGIQLSETS